MTGRQKIEWCSDLDELLTVGYELANRDPSKGRKDVLRDRWNRASNRFKAKNASRLKHVEMTEAECIEKDMRAMDAKFNKRMKQ